MAPLAKRCKRGAIFIRIVQGIAGSGYEPKTWGFADPGCDSAVAVLGALEVLEVLLKGRFIELREEFGGNRGIVTADLIDELTFAHVRFTFKMNGPKQVRLVSP